ncbi:MAG TPA: hypothetical protein VMX75_14425 [Spirochaetia bacterium]|nr:hypothetical protein [Spirochaetia bacterium]
MKKQSVLTIRLSSEARRRLQEIAQTKNANASELGRIAVAAFLEAPEDISGALIGCRQRLEDAKARIDALEKVVILSLDVEMIERADRKGLTWGQVLNTLQHTLLALDDKEKVKRALDRSGRIRPDSLMDRWLSAIVRELQFKFPNENILEMLRNRTGSEVALEILKR